MEKELDENILQPELKVTYNITYKAEFEHKKELFSGSVVYRKHSNNFDLDIHFMKWQRIAGFYATYNLNRAPLGGGCLLTQCRVVASCYRFWKTWSLIH